MKQFDENRFKDALSQAPWDTVFVFDEIDDMLDSWESLFNSVLDEHCPWREKRVKRAVQAPWMTSSVLKQRHLRDNCLKTARRSNTLLHRLASFLFYCFVKIWATCENFLGK